uniref:Chromatin structure-remodeling complex protein SYD-like isoform X4 n=1 Tax=Rhizophora mucronata TaxID=61149 RepID=A0A2P2ME53_RHIMU
MASSQSSPNVEMEAAKFLHKLIQDSKDEPTKLATKLYVILQHMKSSGKENSMPYQVISRAMETVINQNGIDIEALKSSRLPLTGRTPTGDSTTTQYAGSSQAGGGVAKDFKSAVAENDISKIDPFASSRAAVGLSGLGHDYYQGSGTHRSSQSCDHESPSSLDTRSTNSQSQERGLNQKDSRKAAVKRKRDGPSLPSELPIDNNQQFDACHAMANPRKGKMNKVDLPGGISVKGGENSGLPMVPSSGQLEVSSALLAAGQQGSSHPSMHENLFSGGAWIHGKMGFPPERSQVPRFSSSTAVSGTLTAENPSQQPIGSGAFSKVHGGMSSSSFPIAELGLSGPVQFNGSEHQKHGLTKGSGIMPIDRATEAHSFSGTGMDDLVASISAGKVLETDGGNSNMLADVNKSLQGGSGRTTGSRDMGKSPVSQGLVSSGMPFKEQQLRQLRAQCLVFLAFRSGLIPKKPHLEIALGNIFPKDGKSSLIKPEHRPAYHVSVS